jgi:hypothetical protein
LRSTQALHQYKLSPEAYLEKLNSALPEKLFLNTQNHSEVGLQKAGEQTLPKKSRSRRLAGILGAVLLVTFIGFLNRNAITAQLLLNAPTLFFDPIEQQIRFARTKDDARIAYAVTGNGPPLLIALGWSTHLEDGMNSPTYDREGLIAMTSESFTTIRFDGRGFGLPDRSASNMSVAARPLDIEAVVQALELDQFYLYGVSSGGQASIIYAAEHPEKVKGLVLGSTFGNYDYRDKEAVGLWERQFDEVAANGDDDATINKLIARIFPNVDGL